MKTKKKITLAKTEAFKSSTTMRSFFFRQTDGQHTQVMRWLEKISGETPSHYTLARLHRQRQATSQESHLPRSGQNKADDTAAML